MTGTESSGRSRALVLSGATAGILVASYLGIRALRTHRTRVARWTSQAVRRIEERVQRDEGRRGIACLIAPGELHAAAKRLVHASSVAIITGFPCLLKHDPPTETDGPPGAYALARACIALGHKVYLLTDEVNENVLLAGAAGYGLPGSHLHLESFPPKDRWGHKEDQRLQEIADGVDLVVAIERAGPGPDGSYYTMRALRMDEHVAPLERLLSCAPRAWSLGIGDGGNEVGMGKVRDSVLASSIPNAATIHCVTPTDHLIVASVSNWGGYALAAAAALVAAQEGLFDSRSEAVQAMVVTAEAEAALLHRMVEAGARDGITEQEKAMVDGMPAEASLAVLAEITAIATAWSWLW